MIESIEPEDGVVERSVELAAPALEVWEALTAPTGLSVLLGGEVASLDVRSGGRGLLRREDGAVRRIVVEGVDAGRRLRFRWWPYSRPDTPSPLGSTVVEFVLEEHGPTTTLHVVERPPLTTGGGALGAGAARAAIEAGTDVVEAVAR